MEVSVGSKIVEGDWDWVWDSPARVEANGLEKGSERAMGGGVGRERAREMEIPEAGGGGTISSGGGRTIELGSS